MVYLIRDIGIGDAVFADPVPAVEQLEHFAENRRGIPAVDFLNHKEIIMFTVTFGLFEDARKRTGYKGIADMAIDIGRHDLPDEVGIGIIRVEDDPFHIPFVVAIPGSDRMALAASGNAVQKDVVTDAVLRRHGGSVRQRSTVQRQFLDGSFVKPSEVIQIEEYELGSEGTGELAAALVLLDKAASHGFRNRGDLDLFRDGGLRRGGC